MSTSNGMRHRQRNTVNPTVINQAALVVKPGAELEAVVDKEMLDNPALSYDEKAKEQKEESIESPDDISRPTDMETSPGELFDYDRGQSQTTQSLPTSTEEDNSDISIIKDISLNEYLLDQVRMMHLSSTQYDIALKIIGALDDNGYLKLNAKMLSDDFYIHGIDISEEEIKEVLVLIRQLEPAGIASSSPSESLIAQLKFRDKSTKDPIMRRDLALGIKALESYGHLIENKKFDELARKLGVQRTDVNRYLSLFRRLNLHPASGFRTSNEVEMIRPDFRVLNHNGVLHLMLSQDNKPNLKVNEESLFLLQKLKMELKKAKDKEIPRNDYQYIKDKIAEARIFIDNLTQRYHTLKLVMNAVIEYQSKFFITGDPTTLRPMILNDLANQTALDISTISRVASTKYVITEWGTFKLKYFFSESIINSEGEEVSTTRVKELLKRYIAKEDAKRPLSDEELKRMLVEDGYDIARRTVAKYREQMDINVSRLRKG